MNSKKTGRGCLYIIIVIVGALALMWILTMNGWFDYIGIRTVFYLVFLAIIGQLKNRYLDSEPYFFNLRDVFAYSFSGLLFTIVLTWGQYQSQNKNNVPFLYFVVSFVGFFGLYYVLSSPEQKKDFFKWRSNKEVAHSEE